MRRSIVVVVLIALCLGVCGLAAPASAKHLRKKRCIRTRKAVAKAVAKPKVVKAKASPAGKALSAITPAKAAAEELVVCPKPRNLVVTEAATATEPYTSLVIDATGLKLDKTMSPKVFRQCGTEVWGTLKNLTDEDYDILQDRGMVCYTCTVDEAKVNSRAGARPLIVKAVDTQGDKLRCNLVVADADGDLILSENAKGKFLDKYNVILIRNENPPPPPEPAPQPAPAEETPQAEEQPT